jgi:TetR/AcrR family transcriptional regulator, upper aerobic nicotinate degradation pathway regulator
MQSRAALTKTGHKATDTAEQLLHEALDLFAQRNYSVVTIKDIATATGVNTSLIYYYFGSKEELFLRIVEDTATKAIATFEAIRNEDASPEQVVSLWIENHVLQFPLMRKLITISLDYSKNHERSHRVDRAIRRFYDVEAAILGDALRAGFARGVFAANDIDRTVTFISTSLDGTLVRSMMFPRFDARGAIATLREIVLDRLRPPG